MPAATHTARMLAHTRASTQLDATSHPLPQTNCSWNIREVSSLGVVSVYTPKGMTNAVWREGLTRFAAARGGAPAAAGGGGGGVRQQKGGGRR